MKYIRTKDGKIFDSFALKVEEIAYKDEQGEWCKEWRTINPLKKVLKIADTIEELCDEYVWVSVNNEYHNRKANEYGLRTSKMQLGCPQLKTIYGAIWTGQGLIYVAKMNEKGELELL